MCNIDTVQLLVWNIGPQNLETKHVGWESPKHSGETTPQKMKVVASRGIYILLFFVLILQKLKRPFPAGWSPEMM